jgi:selenocysteine lyase/cysteine desulfurase
MFGLSDVSRLAFGPNVTWALNAAIGGLGLGGGDGVLSGGLEHNSTARPLSRLSQETGLKWDEVPPGPDGLLRPDDFRKALRPNTRLVVLNHASNVSGALSPAREIKEAIGEVPILLDTAQTAGAMPLDDLGSFADLIAFTGHKGLLGPCGTGGLWVRPGLELRPPAVGGSGSRSESFSHPDFMPDALEAGTLNTHGLAGLAAGMEFLLSYGLDRARQHEMGLAFAFLEGLSGIKGLSYHQPKAGSEQRVATVSVWMEGWSTSDLAQALEKGWGIMIRAGLHCAPMAHRNLGTFPGGTARFSFGLFNTQEDVRAALEALKELSSGRRP